MRRIEKKVPIDLIKQLAHRSPVIRIESIERLASLLKQPTRELTDMLNDKNELVRVSAVEALQEIGHSSSVGMLYSKLRDPSPLVRSYAAFAIGVIGDQSALPKLKRLLQKERSAQARVGILAGLFLLGNKDQLTALLSLGESSNYLVRCSVANTIAELPLSTFERRQVLLNLISRLNMEQTIAGKSSLRRAIRRIDPAGKRTGLNETLG